MEHNILIDSIYDDSTTYNNRLINFFQFLPAETILSIALTLPISSITALCSVDTRFNSIICANEYFWKSKYIRDFGNVTFQVDNWKNLYLNSGDVWVLTDIEIATRVVTNDLSGISDKFKSIIAISGQLKDIRGLDVALSGSHFVVIDYNNDVWVWGSSTDGQLGVGTYGYISQPYKLDYIKAKHAACSKFATILIDLNDNVYISGAINVLDTNDKFNVERFEQQNIKAKQISAGFNHVALIDFNDDIIVTGRSENGQLGLGPDFSKVKDVGNFYKIPGFKAKKVFCGGNSTAFIDMNDDIWVFGENSDGQLGLGDFKNRHVPTKMGVLKGKEIAMSYYHTMIIDLEGKMWGCGRNTYDELGVGRNSSNLRKIAAPLLVQVADESRNIWENVKWKKVSVSEGKSVAIDVENNIWVCGRLFGKNKNFYVNADRTINKTFKIFEILPGFKSQKIATGGEITIFIGAETQ